MNLQEVMKQQLELRYKNLHMFEEEEKENEGSDEEDDVWGKD